MARPSVKLFLFFSASRCYGSFTTQYRTAVHEQSQLKVSVRAIWHIAGLQVRLANERFLMIPTGTVNEILYNKGGNVWTVSPDVTVFEAIQLMAEKNVGALLVTENDKLVGILSERDYTRKVALRGKSSKELKVAEIVSKEVTTATPSHSIEDCMRLMTDNRVRHLPIMEGPEIKGVVSIGDLVNWIISAQTSTIHQLETYITGHSA
jgi:signal-transduction protein with cAMP-binding, CBS, and nucleotidyltransferase domain